MKPIRPMVSRNTFVNRRVLLGSFEARLVLDQQKMHVEARAFARFVVDQNEAAVVAHDALRHGGVQAGAFADRLGGEEGSSR